MAKQLKFSAVLELAAGQFRSASRSAASSFSDDQKAMAAAAEQVRVKLDQIKVEANKSFASTGVAGLSKQISEVGDKSAASAAQLRAAQGQFTATGAAANNAAGGVGVFGGELTRLAGIGLSLAAVTAGLKGIVDATVKLQQAQNALSAVTGGTLQASTALQSINKTADELGLRATSLTKDFVQLAAATRGTQLEGEQTEKLFKAIAAASATLGLGAGEVSRAFTALQQIIGKGVVSQEELRGQLAEAIPGATQIAARAFGVTTEELNKMVEAGLPAEEFVRKFSVQLEKEFPNAAANAATLGGSINLLANDFDKLQQTLGANFIGPALIAIFKDLQVAIKDVIVSLSAIKNTPEFEALKTAAVELYTNLKELGKVVAESVSSALTELGSLLSGASGSLRDAGSAANDAGGKIGGLTAVLNSVAVTIGFIQDGFTTLTIAIQSFVSVAATSSAAFLDAYGKVASFFGETLGKSIQDAALQLSDIGKTFGDRASAGLENFSSRGVAALDRVTEATIRLAGQKLAPAIEDDLGRIENRAKSVAAASKQVTDEAVQLQQAYTQALGITLGAELSKSISSFEALSRKAGSSAIDIQKAFQDALKGATTQAQIDAIASSYEKVAATGKLSAEQQVASLRLIQDAAIKVSSTLDGALSESLTRLGVTTKAQLSAQLSQVEADIQRVRALASSGQVSSGELQKAETAARASAQDLQTQLAGGISAKEKAAEADRQRAVETAAAAAAEKAAAAEAEKAAEKVKAAAAEKAAAAVAANTYTGAVQSLASAFAFYRNELTALSAAAANKFVANIGGDFQAAKEKVTDTASALAQVRTELATLAAGDVGLGGTLNKTFIDLYNSSLQVKEEFFLQKQAYEGALGALKEANLSSTASVGELAAAITGARQDFDLLNGSDLAALNTAVEAARQKITQLEEAARQTAQSLADMGKTLTQELLRAQGNEVDAIRIEYDKRRKQLEDQAGKFSSDPAVAAEVAKNKELLAQLEQIAIKKQQARDAEARAREVETQLRTRNPANDPSVNRDAQNKASTQVTNSNQPANKTTQVVEFKAPDGTSVSGQFDAESGAAKVVDVLRKSGASSISRRA